MTFTQYNQILTYEHKLLTTYIKNDVKKTQAFKKLKNNLENSKSQADHFRMSSFLAPKSYELITFINIHQVSTIVWWLIPTIQLLFAGLESMYYVENRLVNQDKGNSCSLGPVILSRNS